MRDQGLTAAGPQGIDAFIDLFGPEYVQLGIALAEDGQLDPRIIGDASRMGRYDDQDLKRVWHYVARFGSPD